MDLLSGAVFRLRASDRGGKKKKMDCVAERKDVAVMSSLFADIVLPVCLCILNDLADKVADELNEQKQR